MSFGCREWWMVDNRQEQMVIIAALFNIKTHLALSNELTVFHSICQLTYSTFCHFHLLFISTFITSILASFLGGVISPLRPISSNDTWHFCVLNDTMIKHDSWLIKPALIYLNRLIIHHSSFNFTSLLPHPFSSNYSCGHQGRLQYKEIIKSRYRCIPLLKSLGLTRVQAVLEIVSFAITALQIIGITALNLLL